MKTRFYNKTLIALAVMIAAAAGTVSQAQEQPIPPPAGDSALPANIVPGTPLAEVVKMVQAGVDVATIRTYIANSQSAFNLDADQIVFLKDEGVPTELVNAMLERDKVLYAGTVTPAPAAPVNYSAPASDTAPPPTEVTVNYFNDTLTPYGSWLDVDGYGRCWRPTTVIYDPGWRPYCDRGHWVYTDCGWYWDSDYAWGVAFHYGRWFRHARFGWCWYPDTEWAPSWVTWRSGGEYCGWAPLPPLAVFRPGFGFFYRGSSVAMNFDFGLGADCFMFVSPDHFCDRHPRSFCVPSARVPQIFRQTTVINNFNVNNRFMVNRGISVDRISSVTHRSIEPIHVGALPNAGRQGWRGDGFNRPVQHGAADHNAGRNTPAGNDQFHHGAVLPNGQNNNGNNNRRENPGQPTQGTRQITNPGEPLRTTGQPNFNSPANNHDPAVYRQRPRTEPTVPGNDPRTSQNVLPNQQPVQARQIHGIETPAVSGSQQHGALQLQQRQFIAPNQPRVEQRVESAPRFNTPPPQPPAVQPHNGGGNGADKQNR